jgi:hypothetical protein
MLVVRPDSSPLRDVRAVVFWLLSVCWAVSRLTPADLSAMMAAIRAVVSIPELRPFRLAMLELVLVATVTMDHLEFRADAICLALLIHQGARTPGLGFQLLQSA